MSHLALTSKKVLQDLRAMPRENTSKNLYFMVHRWVVQPVHDRVDRSGFGVVCAVNQPSNPRVNQGSRAHSARLNCNKQVTVHQAVIAYGGPSFTECQNFRVRSWILIAYIAIPATANNRPP
ncbi:MAG TPA: hypothetical protein VJS37_13120 [Terriglobales bacterium]|nr:hypothetical protein [Terriglobales bacterium]